MIPSLAGDQGRQVPKGGWLERVGCTIVKQPLFQVTPMSRLCVAPLPGTGRWPLLAILVAALTAGCGDSTAPRPAPAGTFSVTLSGAQSGHYEANGALPPRAVPGTTATFAAALAGGPTGDGYLISGFRASSPTAQDVISLDVRGVLQPGEYLGMGNLALEIDAATRLPARVYRMIGASVRITTLSRTRIAGEFSGQAIGGTFPSTFPPLASDTVHLTAGTFDVPIVRR